MSKRKLKKGKLPCFVSVNEYNGKTNETCFGVVENGKLVNVVELKEPVLEFEKNWIG